MLSIKQFEMTSHMIGFHEDSRGAADLVRDAVEQMQRGLGNMLGSFRNE